MKTFNAKNVVDLLNNAYGWDYEYCTGDRVRESTMNEYIAQIEEAVFTEDMLNKCNVYLDDCETDTQLSLEGQQENLDIYVALYIADAMAQQVVDCIYESVTFKVNL